MDFQTNQKQAKKGTRRLILLLGLGTIALVLTLSAIATGIAFWADFPALPQVFAVTASLSAAGILLSAVIRNAQVRNGGGVYTAASLGGWPIDFNTRDQAEKQLVNIVEEIAVASGVPSPIIFVLRDEPGINAFAAGWNLDNAAIGVTMGALRHLTRSELQAVVAHEFSHIVNGDTQIKTRILGWVHGIASTAAIGKSMMKSVSPTRSGMAYGSLPAASGGQLAIGSVIVGAILASVGSIAAWFARLAQASVTREREHLADASAVEFTRDPDSLAGALLKIGALGKHNGILTRHASEAAHLFFDSPFPSSHARTHPPLQQRVLALVPSWNGRWPQLEQVKQSVNIAHDISFDGFALPEIPGLPTNVAEAAQNIPGISAHPLGPVLGQALLLDQLGTEQAPTGPPKEAVAFKTPELGPPTDAHIEHARRILNAIPQQTKDFLHTSEGAVATLLGLLISRDPKVRPEELRRASALSGFDEQSLDEASDIISSLDRRLHLACLDMALNSIRKTPAEFQHELLEMARDFATSSPDADLYRWMLRRVAIRHLTDAEQTNTPQDNLYLEWLVPQAARIYGIVALYNSSGVGAQHDAFRAAFTAAGIAEIPPMPKEVDLRIKKVDAALDKLSQMTHQDRVAFVEGIIAAITVDGLIDINEAELVRVIADTVRLPMPPILPIAPTDASSGLAA